MKKFALLFLLAFMAMSINAQRFTNETPPSFAYEQIAKAKLKSAKKLAIPFDVQALKVEDAEKEELGSPVRVAKAIPVDLTPENAGEWLLLPNGQRIWRLEIEAPGANAISLLFDKFAVPQGGKLFIYSTDYKVIDVYTDRDNPKREEYSTDFISGDKIRLEYVEPLSAEQLEITKAVIPQTTLFLTKEEKLKEEKEEKAKSPLLLPFATSGKQESLQIKITGVSYAYKDVLATIVQTFKDIYAGMEVRTPSEVGQSGACEVNINDTEGTNWQHQKRGVAATLQVLGDGNYICSGTVVNNVLGDLAPYFLMAYHCGGDATDAQFNQWRFYFHWERTGAGNDSPLEEYKMLTGATKKVAIDISAGSDGLLLLLNESIPNEWDVFYNGWDRRNSATAGGVGIHHPAGDVKKISTYTGTPASYTWNGSDGSVGAANAHWNVTFTATEHGHGVTEGGSSGSPLFNSAGRVIGTLTGGSSSCTSLSGANLYGKLAYHWDQFENQKMADFLDPNNTGAEYIDGTYAEEYKVTFSASKTEIAASEEIIFTNRSYGDIDTWVWSFTGGYPAGHNGKNPPAVLYLNPGNYTAKLTAKKAGQTVGELEVPIKVTLKQNYCPATTPVTIGTGTSTSQYPLGMGSGSTRNALSAAIYTASELGLTDGGVITDLEWTANTAVTTARTLYIYLKEVDETSFASATTWTNEINGATLVYQSASTWTNVAGANKVTLTTPFTYSGTKNLKVLVRASSAAAGSTSSATRYTASGTNTHQQWGNTTAALPTANGTRNANRPNIKFYYNEPCGVEAPLADFIAAEEILLLKEGFDSTTFPPTGWTREKPGASANQWQLGNPNSSNFNTIDPSSTSSVTVAYDSYNVVDTWLKSPALAIDETGAKIEFYVLYSGSWLDGGATTFYVSDDEGSNWTTKWTTGTTNNTSLPSAWRKQEIDLSEYVGKSIRFAWQYYGQDGDLAGLDGIKVYLPNPEGKATIYEGEFVNFSDRSTGPVVTWNWTLPGGIPSTSTLAAPAVQYLNEGVYDAQLFVKNSIGTSEKTIPGAVIVRPHIPIPNFASYSNGFTKQANFGPFLPLSGGPVEFEHSTLHYPKSVAWTFPGANPSSSTEEYPLVEYPAGEAKYDVTLEATNNAGTGSETKTDYIQVGGTAEVWNVREGESPLWRYVSGSYALTGADVFTQTAERFSAPAGGEISQVRVYTSNVTQSTSGYLTLAIYSDNGGLPGTAISPVLQIQGGSNRIVNGGYNTLTFTTPVPVSGAFHVVIGSTNYNYTYFTVPCVENRPDGYSTVSAYYQSAWYDLGDLVGLYTSMNIIPEFTYTTAELTSPVVYNKKNVDETTETIAFTTTGHSWSASASDSWIQLSAASGSIDGSGNGSLTFTVSENTKQDIRKGSIKLNIGGTAFTVNLKQAGAAPEDLTATYNDEGTTVNLAWKHEVPYYKPGDNIFDDAESYPAFMKNPKGYYPWSYIDGDGADTYGIEDFTFPGSGAPIAFIAFNSSNLTGYEAKSGTNYFAAFASTIPPNDDWLISPELGFEEPFTFSFWAKSLTNTYNGGERFNVYYSTGGKAKEDFTNKLTDGEYVVPPLDYALYSYTVPANAKYVAINCITDDEFIFMVDDIFIGTGEPPVSTTSTPLKSNWDIDKGTLKRAKPASIQQVSENKLKLSSDDDRLVELTHKQGAEAVAIALPPALRSDEATEAEEEALQWSDGTPYYIYGRPDGGLQEVAIRFAPEDLFFYDEATIKAVEIYTYRPATNVKLNIRKGNQIVHSQDIGDITENLKKQRIELTTPVVIDATEDLYVGYEYVQAEGGAQEVYVALADESPAESGKGDLYSYNGAPFSSTGVGDWLITAYVEQASLDITFNVYKNGTLVAEGLTEKSYADTEGIEVNKRARYTVTAIYGKPELESTGSLPVTLYAPVAIVTEDTLTFCDGEEATLQAPDEEGYAYKWYLGETLITDATESNFVATESGDYSVQVTSDEGVELPVTEAVTVTVNELPVTPAISILYAGEGAVTFEINNPQEGVSYQWYFDSEAIGEPLTSSVYTVYETGTYSVIATNSNECDSETSNTIAVTIVLAKDLFSVPTDPISFAGAGGEEEVAITLSDPKNYISALGFTLNTDAPDWITVTEENGTLTLEARANETNAFLSDTVRVWYGRPNNGFDSNNGYKIAVTQKSLQSITFETPAALLLQDGTYPLSATATSGLDVTFGLRAEDAAYAEIQAGNVLQLKQTGKVLVTASVGGNDEYEAATDVSNEIAIVLAKDLFSVPTDAISLVGAGDEKEVAITLSDPEDYISVLELSLYTSAPEWITVTAENGTLTLEAGANETNAFRSATVQVWYEKQDSEFSSTGNGYEITVNQKALQSITFETPEILYLHDGTYSLSATATSGLDVTFGLRAEDAAYAEIREGNVLHLIAEGEIIVTASVGGNDEYEAATDVSNEISIQRGTGIEIVAKGKLNVYPNPSLANHIFYVASGLDESELRNTFIDVYNLSGALILRQEVTGKITEISLPNQGTYFLRLKGEEVTVIIK